MNRFPPQQFDFNKFWYEDFSKLDTVPAIVDALEVIKVRWRERTEFIYEESGDHNPEQARAEYQLSLLTGEVMVRNLTWLRENFENIDLCDLSLAIAEEVFPEKVWKVIEGKNGAEAEAVVTDDEYSLVFDMQYFDEIEAGSSLLLVEAPDYVGTPEQQEEMNIIVEEYGQMMSHAVELSRSHLEEAKKSGSITFLHPDLHPEKH